MRTSVLKTDNTWTVEITICPEYNPQGQSTTLGYVTVSSGMFYVMVDPCTQGWAPPRSWQVAVAAGNGGPVYIGEITDPEDPHFGEYPVIVVPELSTKAITVQIQLPSFYINRVGQALTSQSGLPPPLLAKERAVTDSYVVEDGEATLSCPDLGSRTVSVTTYTVGTPEITADFGGNSDACTVAARTAQVRIGTPSGNWLSFAGISGQFNGINPYRWPPADNYLFTGSQERLALDMTPSTHEPETSYFASVDFSSTAYSVDWSQVRMFRQVPGELYPTTQPEEFEGARVWGGFKVLPSGMPVTPPQKEDTELGFLAGQSGAFAIGAEFPPTVGELIDLGLWNQSSWRAIDAHTEELVYSPVFWQPPISLRLDEKWAYDNKWHLKREGFWGNDHGFTIAAPMCDKQSCTGEPWNFVEMVLAPEINVDLSGSVGSRLTPWEGEGVSEGGVGTADWVQIDNEAAQVGSMTRSFLTNFDAKVAWVLDPENNGYGALPELYWYLAQNAPSVPEGGPWPDEDVVCWNYGWEKVLIEAPESVSPADKVRLDVTYQYIASVTDNHMTTIERMTDFAVDLSILATVTYSITDLEPGVNTRYICLPIPAAGLGPRLELVRSATVTFPMQAGAASWKWLGPSLVKDPTQSVHVYAHFGEDWLHLTHIPSGHGRSGGLRCRVDGLSRAITVTDDFQAFQYEPILPCIFWLLSQWEDVFLEHVYTLRQYLERACCIRNGFSVALTEGQWADWYDDDDGAAYDIAPVWNYPDYLPLAIRGGAWNIVPALTYKPYISLVVGGGAEGLVAKAGEPYRNAADAVVVTRDTAEQSELVELVDTDEHGVYLPGFYREAYDYTESQAGQPPETLYTPVRYTYYAKGAFVGQLYRRQVLLESLLLRLVPNLHAIEHFSHMGLVSDCALFDRAGWSSFARGKAWNTRVIVPETEGLDWANLCVNSSRQEWVGAQGRSIGIALARGLNGPLGAATALPAYSSPCAVFWHGFLYLTAYSEGNHYLLRFIGSGDHLPLPRWVNLIGPGDDAAAGLACSPMSWSLAAAVPNAGNTDLYFSRDQGATWNLVHTEPGLTYPALAFNRSDETLWLVGYSSTPAEGATGSAVFRAYRAGLSSLTLLRSSIVGGADEGRPALLRNSQDWSLRVIAPKIKPWTAPGETPGRAEYLSTDSGATWELQAVHGE